MCGDDLREHHGECVSRSFHDHGQRQRFRGRARGQTACRSPLPLAQARRQCIECNERACQPLDFAAACFTELQGVEDRHCITRCVSSWLALRSPPTASAGPAASGANDDLSAYAQVTYRAVGPLTSLTSMHADFCTMPIRLCGLWCLLSFSLVSHDART